VSAGGTPAVQPPRRRRYSQDRRWAILEARESLG